jgi:hypothetical protein
MQKRSCQYRWALRNGCPNRRLYLVPEFSTSSAHHSICCCTSEIKLCRYASGARFDICSSTCPQTRLLTDKCRRHRASHTGSITAKTARSLSISGSRAQRECAHDASLVFFEYPKWSVRCLSEYSVRFVPAFADIYRIRFGNRPTIYLKRFRDERSLALQREHDSDTLQHLGSSAFKTL